MRGFYTAAALTLLLLLTLPMLGMAGCPTADPGSPDYVPPDFTAEDLVRALDVADAGNAMGHYYAVRDGNFDACMVTAGIDAGITGAQLYAPQIESEALAPDCSIGFPAYSFSALDCLPFVPDPWPPTEPNPQLAALVDPMVGSSFGMASALIMSQAPTEGEGCVRAHVASAILASTGDQVRAILDEAMVSATLELEIAGFAVDYSGCGVCP